MRTQLSSTDLPQELDGFAGGMGFKSIASISETELGFSSEDFDVKGYISEPVDGVYYAEVMNGCGNSTYACGAIDEMQRWLSETVYDFCQE